MIRPEVRFATEADTEGVITVMRRTGMGQNHIVNERIEDLLLENLLVALDKGEVVGFIFWICGRRHAYIDTLAVLPEYQNTGVGVFLTFELFKYLFTLNIKSIYACTHPDQGRIVRNMLSRAGFETRGHVVGMSLRVGELQ